MPLKKIQLKPGVNRENTRYTTEGGWYESDKIRFRQGNPEKIGGWERISASTYLGVCRSLWNWGTLNGQNLIGVGTNLKFYIERGGSYYDVTPIRSTVSLTNPFFTTNGSATVTVHQVGHGAVTGDYVTFSGATTVGGLDLNHEYSVYVTDVDNFTITASAQATSTVAGGGGTVSAAWQINIGNAIQVPIVGWGGGGWGSGTWGFGDPTVSPMRLWTQTNFGEDLVFSYRGGALFYWRASTGVNTRGIYVSSMAGASDVPDLINYSLVSDVNRFVFAFGCTEIGSVTQDPMLVRWSDQEDITMWTPAATNQAGSLRLSHGSEIVTAIQARQEVVVITDTSLYSMQYQGLDTGVWGAQLLGDSLSIAGQNAAVYVSNTTYWMGKDKFYIYDGTVRPLSSDLRRYVFNDFNHNQYDQVFAAANESFHEVWWFYCSANSTQVDRYVVYNYMENIWYYGTMGRTAWVDSGLRQYPVAATYSNNLVSHEKGVDDKTTATTLPIVAYIASSEFDLDDGQHFMLINRVLPDVTFDGSTADLPTMTMTLLPMSNSGSGYNSPASVGGNSSRTIARTAVVPIEKFTGQVFVRIRGRQLVMQVQSDALGVTWQLGSPRLDMQQDGRRGAS
jgi:hypothetical protein